MISPDPETLFDYEKNEISEKLLNLACFPELHARCLIVCKLTGKVYLI